MIRPQAVSLQPSSPKNGTSHLTISAHGGRILSADTASSDLTGYSTEELTSLRLGDLLKRQEYTQVMAFLEQSLLAEGGVLEGIQVFRKDGSSRSVILRVEVDKGIHNMPRGTMTSSPRPDWPTALHCSLQDITAQELVGQELRQRKQALSSLHALADSVRQTPQLERILGEALEQILKMLDLQMGGVYVTERRDGEGAFTLRAVGGVASGLVENTPPLLETSPLIQQLRTDGREHSVPGGQSTPFVIRERILPSSDLLPSYWREAGMQAFMAQLLETQQWSGGLLLVGATQQHHFSSRDRDLLELSSHQLAMAIENGLLFQELTERIQDLSAMRQFRTSILRDMSDGLLTVDAQGQITTLNPAAEEILQYSASLAQGQDLASLLGEDSPLVALVRKAMSAATYQVRGELVLQRGDGQPVPVGASVAVLQAEATGVPISEEEVRQVTGAVVVFTDLTEQKRAEDERQYQDRLALLGEMTAVLAHEVRNPLAGVVHGIQYLVEESSLDGEAAEYAHLILEDSRRISRLLDDVLLISRPQQVELISCDLQSLLEGLLHQWRARAAARRVEVRTVYAKGLRPPSGDPARLEQVFSNLISNALNAMPEGGTLWLRVRPVQLPSSLPGQDSRPAVRVEVEDTGSGIPAHALQRVFEPFFTTRKKGTGLGLAIARRIVRDHQGEIEVKSEEGKGTLMGVILPVAEEYPSIDTIEGYTGEDGRG